MKVIEQLGALDFLT